MKRTTSMLLKFILIVTTLLIFGCSATVSDNESEEIIAEVNTIPITETEFNHVKANLELESFLTNGEVTNEEVLKTLIRPKILGQEARDRGVGISEEEVKEVIDAFKDSENEVPPEIMEALQDNGFNSFDEFLQNNNLEYESFEEYVITRIRYFYQDGMDTLNLDKLVREETYERLKTELEESKSDIDQDDLWKIDRQHHRIAELEINEILQRADIEILDPELNVSDIDFPMEELDDQILTFNGESENWEVLYVQDNATGAEDQLLFTYRGESELDSITITGFTYEFGMNRSGTRTLSMKLDEQGKAYLSRELLDLDEQDLLTTTIQWNTPEETLEETIGISIDQ